MAGNFNVGLTYSGVAAYVKGDEKLKTTGVTTKGDAVHTLQIPSLFLEYNTGEMTSAADGWVWGVDVIPLQAQIVEEQRQVNDQIAAYDTLTSKNINSVSQKVKADLKWHTMAYVETPGVLGGFYLKGGVQMAQIRTREQLGTGATYPNAEIRGATVGLGFKKYLGNLFTRLEGSWSQYERIDLKSRNSDAVTTVTAKPQIGQVRFSIGVAF
tara:strand:- start:218 stop:853 length:636 start_codon:yes stop_codon:yes gene_type:complete